MAKTQTIVMTVIPRGRDEHRLPAGVRLRDAQARRRRQARRLPDWLQWTRRLKENGLTLTLRCEGNEQDVTVDPQRLDPLLWESLFTEDTFVRSFEFDDYSGPVMSYSVRQALSVLKSIYQQAGVSLALPEDSGQSKERGNRFVLRQLLDGLDVNWSPRDGEHWRDLLRRRSSSGGVGGSRRRSSRRRSSMPRASSRARRAPPRSSPSPSVLRLPSHADAEGPRRQNAGRGARPDWDTQLDFHQALGSLNAYRSLQRRSASSSTSSSRSTSCRHTARAVRDALGLRCRRRLGLVQPQTPELGLRACISRSGILGSSSPRRGCSRPGLTCRRSSACST